MLEGNNHWNEELRSKLWRAKQWKEKLELEIKLQQLALEKWITYIAALEQAQELENELDLDSGALINGSGKAKTVTEFLIVFAFQKPDYIFTVKDCITSLTEQGLYLDEKGAGDSIYGILAHRTDLFKRQDRALYKLTDKAIDIGKNLTLPRLPLDSRSSPLSVSRRHTPLASFVLESLRSGRKTLTILKGEAEKAGFSSGEKRMGRVLHFALVGMARSGLVERANGVWGIKEPITGEE